MIVVTRHLRFRFLLFWFWISGSYTNLTSLYAKTSDLYSKTKDNYSNSTDQTLKADTKSVLNKIWFDSNSVNGNTKQNNHNTGSHVDLEKTAYKPEKDVNCSEAKPRKNEIYVVNSEFGQFKSNRRYEPAYQSTTSDFGDVSNANNYQGKWIFTIDDFIPIQPPLSQQFLIYTTRLPIQSMNPHGLSNCTTT